MQAPHLLESLNRNAVSAPLTVNLASGSDVNAPIDVNLHPPQRDEGDSAGQSEDFDDDDVKPSVSGRKREAQGGGEESVTGRKKLKLSKEQAELLEKAFRENNTLNPVRAHDSRERLEALSLVRETVVKIPVGLKKALHVNNTLKLTLMLEAWCKLGEKGWRIVFYPEKESQRMSGLAKFCPFIFS